MANHDNSTEYPTISEGLAPLDRWLIDNVSEVADEDRIQGLTTHLALAGLLGAFGGSNTEALSATKMLIDTDAFLQYLDPDGASRDVEAPAEGNENHPFLIVNTADAAETLTFKDDGGSTIATVAQGEAKLFVSDGTDWKVLSGGGGSSNDLTPSQVLFAQVFGS